jgi:hypothetical protein
VVRKIDTFRCRYGTPVVLGDLTKDSQIKAFLHDVPPTICFDRLVFEHIRDLNFKVIGVKSPESLRTVKEVTMPSGQSLQINLKVQLTAPDYKEPNQEFVESPLIFVEQGASGSEPSVDHMP